MSGPGALTPPRAALVPLVLAQFICGFAGSSPSVMINDISADLHTTVQGVQLVITTFLLVVAALMIPGGKLTDRYGRKRCFVAGLAVYGIGAVLSALAPGLGVLVLGNSILEGAGAALLIPPVYILATLLFTDTTSRARAIGVIMAMGGIGAAAGPLLGGLITSGLGWRAAFVFQALVVASIAWLGRRIDDPAPMDPAKPFDIPGAVLSTVGMVLPVMGILAADEDVRLMWALLAVSAVVLVCFFLWIRAEERAGREPLISMGLLRNRTAALGFVTQNLQWLLLMGTIFVVAAYLQVVRGYNAIQTGVVFTAATVGLLGSSWAATRLSRRYPQRILITAGFAVTVVGINALLVLAGRAVSPWAFAPGLLLIGVGSGVIPTPAVDIVRSGFGGEQQDEISAWHAVCPTSAPRWASP
ncbi:MFS transporter [Nocardia brevicatena]|uniref:MFS transporter n=1 Tax=Nocardia brevicatena TaxID=37327 RepID=UPI0002EC9201|nr:MFS transporter [Nocardia brevicatena]